MTFDRRTLQRYQSQAARPAGVPDADPLRPPLDPDTVLIGAGNSGEALVLRCQAIGYSDGVFWSAAGLNNDRLPPRPITVRRADGTTTSLALGERLVMDGDNPRERMLDYPLLVDRYRPLLRGVPVFETFPRAGAGGHGYPVIAALDLDLHIDAVLHLLRRTLAVTRDEPAQAAGQSAVQRVIAQSLRRQETTRERRIVVVGGLTGAMGNAAHHLVPYLVRQLMAEQGVSNYEIWGVLLGPRAFTGLTPFVRHNARALLEAIEHLSRHGQQRAYINDLVIRSQQPPYDRVFILDDPALPRAGTTTTEAELEQFLDRTALSLALVLRRSIWQPIASHLANQPCTAHDDGRLRYLHTVQSALIGADRGRLEAALTSALAARALDAMLDRFAAPES